MVSSDYNNNAQEGESHESRKTNHAIAIEVAQTNCVT
jgi:hypothetical protein